MTEMREAVDVFQAGSELYALPTGTIRRIRKMAAGAEAEPSLDFVLEEPAEGGPTRLLFPSQGGSRVLLDIRSERGEIEMEVDRVIHANAVPDEVIPFGTGDARFCGIGFVTGLVVLHKDRILLLALEPLLEKINTWRNHVAQ